MGRYHGDHRPRCHVVNQIRIEGLLHKLSVMLRQENIRCLARERRRKTKRGNKNGEKGRKIQLRGEEGVGDGRGEQSTHFQIVTSLLNYY